MNSHDQSVNIDTAQNMNERMYLFSAEMNLRTMSVMAITAYFMIFLSGAMSVLNGNLIVPGEKISPFFINATLVISLLVIFISLGRYIRTVVKAVVGKGGASYFAPQATSMPSYLKIAVILLILGFFIVIQSSFIINAPYTLDNMSILSYIMMFIGFIFGAVGLLQAIGLHRRYLKEQSV
ncbi:MULTISPECIES: hypothetical protein [Acinetobacter]|uniref:DUF3278 domain-containing protein n=1 Tax=Acinetobacter indicus TaxID=756892 RepID=A0A6C0Y860_9GAMM|nr:MULTISPECIES: hypothetical protein [Acinetobacter]QIC72052.1 hypothetical protein FSC09_16985 [Acinetobacter indicus]QKQ71547.1 hypothetical protein E5Y90_15045 [Acinetobacter sp. 10FS3-1]